MLYTKFNFIAYLIVLRWSGQFRRMRSSVVGEPRTLEWQTLTKPSHSTLNWATRPSRWTHWPMSSSSCSTAPLSSSPSYLTARSGRIGSTIYCSTWHQPSSMRYALSSHITQRCELLVKHYVHCSKSEWMETIYDIVHVDLHWNKKNAIKDKKISSFKSKILSPVYSFKMISKSYKLHWYTWLN